MSGTKQPYVLNISDRLCSAVLRLYPAALRARYEHEMSEIFQDLVRAAWERSGYRGIGRVWLWVTVEAFRIAFPACMRTSGVGTLSLLTAAALFYLFSVDTLHGYYNRACSSKTHVPASLRSPR